MASIGGVASARVAVQSVEETKAKSGFENKYDKHAHVDNYYQNLCKLEATVDIEPAEAARDHYLQLGMSVMVVLSVLLVSLEVDYGPHDDSPQGEKLFWLICEIVFTIVFTAEIIVGVWLHLLEWFRNPWNWLDCVVVSVSFVQISADLFGTGGGNLQVLKMLRALRLARLVRLVKIIKSCKSIYIVIMAWYSAMGGCLQVYVMMMVGLFFYATIATATIGQNPDLMPLDLGAGRTVETTFGSIPISMYSLFQLMTLEGFESTTRPIVMQSPIFFIFFATFVMIFSFGLLNMLVGLVVSRTIGETTRLEQEAKESSVGTVVDTLRTVFNNCDKTNKGTITWVELDEQLRGHAETRQLLEGVGLPAIDSDDLFNVVDLHGLGCISLQQWVVGCCKLYGNEAKVEAMCIHAAVRSLRGDVKAVIKQQTEMRNVLCGQADRPMSASPRKRDRSGLKADADIDNQETSVQVVAKEHAMPAIPEGTPQKSQNDISDIRRQLAHQEPSVPFQSAFGFVPKSPEAKLQDPYIALANIAPMADAPSMAPKHKKMSPATSPRSQLSSNPTPRYSIVGMDTVGSEACSTQQNGLIEVIGELEKLSSRCESILLQYRIEVRGIVDACLDDFSRQRLRDALSACLKDCPAQVPRELSDRLNTIEASVSEMRYHNMSSTAARLPPKLPQPRMVDQTAQMDRPVSPAPSSGTLLGGSIREPSQDHFDGDDQSPAGGIYDR